MNYILSNGEYTVHDDHIQTFSALPAGMYRIHWHPEKGWWLTNDHPIHINEKIYGDHQRRVDRVIETFKIYPRNLGVLLSGNKGMGKSLVCKMICQRMIEEGYPIITVSEYIPGISNFLHQIDTECVIFFDEFDKLFHQSEEDYSNNSIRPQDEMLGLFDGVDTNKKLFLVTCNQIDNISNYFVNRPGRFHYHFRFTYPTAEEVEVYLNDNVKDEYKDEIINVLAFAQKVRMNYDCLRSIVFELNLGRTFYDFIDDLNILNVQNERYEIILVANNQTYNEYDYLDFMNNNMQTFWLYPFNGGGEGLKVSFNINDFKYDDDQQCYVPENLSKVKVTEKEGKEVKPQSFVIKSPKDNTFSYFNT